MIDSQISTATTLTAETIEHVTVVEEIKHESTPPELRPFSKFDGATATQPSCTVNLIDVIDMKPVFQGGEPVEAEGFHITRGQRSYQTQPRTLREGVRTTIPTPSVQPTQGTYAHTGKNENMERPPTPVTKKRKRLFLSPHAIRDLPGQQWLPGCSEKETARQPTKTPPSITAPPVGANATTDITMTTPCATASTSAAQVP